MRTASVVALAWIEPFCKAGADAELRDDDVIALVSHDFFDLGVSVAGADEERVRVGADVLVLGNRHRHPFGAALVQALAGEVDRPRALKIFEDRALAVGKLLDPL